MPPSTTSTQTIPLHILYTITLSDVQETTKFLLQKAISKNDEFLLLFRGCLTPKPAKLWFRLPKGIKAVARKGGLTKLPESKFVSKAIKLN